MCRSSTSTSCSAALAALIASGAALGCTEGLHVTVVQEGRFELPETGERTVEFPAPKDDELFASVVGALESCARFDRARSSVALETDTQVPDPAPELELAVSVGRVGEQPVLLAECTVAGLDGAEAAFDDAACDGEEVGLLMASGETAGQVPLSVVVSLLPTEQATNYVVTVRLVREFGERCDAH